MSRLQRILMIVASALVFTLANGANVEKNFELDNGHIVVVLDDQVETAVVEQRPSVPGKCSPRLALRGSGGEWKVQRDDPGCSNDANGVLRLNPAWVGNLSLHMTAGQVDLAGDMLARLSALRAAVKVGDVTGVPGVRRTWLVGAQVDLQQPGEGMSLQVRVGAGQISFLK
ncbi:hypothetical protein [Massilia consociata]|uniref:Uncharacterized protein n=1 Tax=Massilia consociata TaxID=760117 RepID=A0ABV6FFE8_9BURK